MTLIEYDRRWAALLAVWQALHRATDTPESAAAVRALFVSLRALGQYAAVRNGAPEGARVATEEEAYRLLDALCENGALSVDEVASLRELGPQSRRLSSFSSYSEEQDRASVNLVTRCLPALWRVVNVLQDELRSQRTFKFHLRRLRRVVTGVFAIAIALVLLEALVLAVGLLRPTGWRVSYYSHKDFTHLRALRGEQQLSRDYELSAPALFVHRNRWSARWEGRLVVPEDGNYTFVIQADDGYRFYLNGELKLESWREQSWRSGLGKVELDLKAGTYPVCVEHFDSKGRAAIRVRWTGGPIPRDTVLGAPYVLKP